MRRIKRPRFAQFSHYCFECARWARDVEYEHECAEIWNGYEPEPRGTCGVTGMLTDCYRQACPNFVGRRER